MELRPHDPSRHDEREESDDEPHGYWVAEVLGDAWRSEGDGIYRYVPELDESSAPDPEPADGPALVWRLECGHDVPLLEDERPDEPPRRPRLCPVCGKLRKGTVEPES